QRPISTRSKNPASAKAVKLTRMRPIIRASSRYPLPTNHDSKSPRVKKVFSPRRHMSSVVGRLRMLTPRSLLAARRRPRRALNVAITADYWERRLEDGASSPLITHVFDVADQIADDF